MCRAKDKYITMGSNMTYAAGTGFTLNPAATSIRHYTKKIKLNSILEWVPAYTAGTLAITSTG